LWKTSEFIPGISARGSGAVTHYVIAAITNFALIHEGQRLFGRDESRGQGTIILPRILFGTTDRL